MPTGYTHKICSDPSYSFAEYFKKCTEQFIPACRDSNDFPSREEAGKWSSNSYGIEQLKKAESELQAFLALAPEERFEIAAKDIAYKIKYHTDKIVETKAVLARLEHFRTKAYDYQPSSKDLSKFKEFLIQQLETTIQHDGSWKHHEDELAKLTGKKLTTWCAEHVKSLSRDITYYTEDVDKSTERMKGLNGFLDAIYGDIARVADEQDRDDSTNCGA